MKSVIASSEHHYRFVDDIFSVTHITQNLDCAQNLAELMKQHVPQLDVK